MPYCPKCDMEFIEGITVCTDCGGPLVESEEVAKAMKAEEKARALERERAMYQEYLNSINGEPEDADADDSDDYPDGSEYDGADEYSDDFEAGDPSGSGYSRSSKSSDGSGGPDGSDDPNGSGGPNDDSTDDPDHAATASASAKGAASRPRKAAPRPEPARVYVDKSQKYDDLKSSATAFLMVGAVLLIVSVLCWTNVIRIPMAAVSKLVFQSVLTVMAVFSLAVYVNTIRSAKKLAPEIAIEQNRTKELVSWFTETYTAEDIDSAIDGRENLSKEELSLKRFQLIQDYLVTGQDLPDPSYVDALSEEIYGRLFENAAG